MNYNLENILVIDLTKSNYQNLQRLIDDNKINEMLEDDILDVKMLSDNKKYGLCKLFIDKTKGHLIAYTTKKDKETVVLVKEFTKDLLNIKPLELKKNSKMDLDSILDKISKFGKNSLKEKELSFLENLSKN